MGKLIYSLLWFFFFFLFLLDIFVFHSFLPLSITILISLNSFGFVHVLIENVFGPTFQGFFFLLVKGLGF